MLDKDLIPQPHLWTMGLLIGRKSIEATFFPPIDIDEIIHHRIVLDPGAPSQLKAVEDAIYDNPLLLNPYKRVFAAFDTDRFAILPSSLEGNVDSLAAKAIALSTGLDTAPADSIVSTPATASASLSFEIPATLAGFLRRTFFNVELFHPLSPLTLRLTSEAEANPEGLITANLRDNRLDIVATRNDSLLLANTFTISAPADAAYYLLAVRSSLSLAPSARIQLAGDPTMRDRISQIIAEAAPTLPSPMAFPLPTELWRAGSAIGSAPLSSLLKFIQ